MIFGSQTPLFARARAVVGCLCACAPFASHAQIGADIPWTTIEAETMRTSGAVLGPICAPHRVEMESSGQRCVRLARAGDFVEFTSPGDFNALVLRFSLPDAPEGGGMRSTLELRIADHPGHPLALDSRNAHLYGRYPFSNDPAQGKPRNFYDELRLKNLEIGKGDVVRLRKTSDDGVDCIVDLIDLERVPPPLARQAASLSVRDFGAIGDGVSDDTEAVRKAIAALSPGGGVVWVPAGDYRIAGDILVTSGVTIQGAGLWHTTFVGDAALYDQAARRVRFKLTGENVHLADFAIVGQLNYRNDQEPNDGVVVAECTDATVSRLWVEHTKAGVWVYNGARLRIDGCRFRNLLADGVNFCVGTNHSLVESCTARGTGDDCFAVWPAPADQGHDELASKPGHNVIRRCTGQLPFLANGASLYGGADNRIEDCVFTDISAGCGILISTTFSTASDDGTVDNNFSGITTVQNVRLLRCGGYDHDWAWRGALQICVDRRSIAGLRLSGVSICDSLSDAISVVAPGRAKHEVTLRDAVLEQVNVSGVGLGTGTGAGRGLWVRKDAAGGLALRDSRVGIVANESDAFVIATDAQ